MLARTDTVATIAESWLAQFEAALAAPGRPGLDRLFHADSHWRDVLALSWHIKTVSGSDAIVRELATHAGRARPTGFKIDLNRTAPRDVLVVGGGQAGLSIAARLAQLGLDMLIVDREARVGDNWRKRYHALVLHNQVHVNHLPYMPFPPNWPTYIPKDKLAAWFEAYVEAMELNYWTDTEFEGGTYDEKEGRWSLAVRRGDGTKRLLHPRHVIMATGVSGI